jgi:hypothetical protein
MEIMIGEPARFRDDASFSLCWMALLGKLRQVVRVPPVPFGCVSRKIRCRVIARTPSLKTLWSGNLFSFRRFPWPLYRNREEPPETATLPGLSMGTGGLAYGAQDRDFFLSSQPPGRV